MRVLTEGRSEAWICLELPARPDDAPGTVRVECNSGAERVEVVVPATWDALADPDLLARIHAARGR